MTEMIRNNFHSFPPVSGLSGNRWISLVISEPSPKPLASLKSRIVQKTKQNKKFIFAHTVNNSSLLNNIIPTFFQRA